MSGSGSQGDILNQKLTPRDSDVSDTNVQPSNSNSPAPRTIRNYEVEVQAFVCLKVPQVVQL